MGMAAVLGGILGIFKEGDLFYTESSDVIDYVKRIKKN